MPSSGIDGSRRRRCLVAVAFVLGLSGAAWAIEGQGAVGIDQEPEALQARSEVKSLAIALAGAIPKAPPSAASREFCEHLTTQPKSPAGRLVASRGWAVTGEVRLPEGRQAVSFAGKFEHGTSGTCLVSEGNVAVFRGERLLAIAYAPRAARDTIGKVVPLEGGGARIWSGDYLSQPLADLRVENGGTLLALAPLAAEESLCGGRATVPNVYGMPIDRARKVLAAQGWTPLKGAIGNDRAQFGRELDLIERGILEVESCSGTGFGYCAYCYRGPAGTLSVSTVGDGEFPTVSGYDVTCR